MNIQLDSIEILNPDSEVQQNLINSLRAEVFDDLKKEGLFFTESDNNYEEILYKEIDNQQALMYLDKLQVIAPDTVKEAIVHFANLVQVIYMSAQQHLSIELLKKYLIKVLPEIDLSDTEKIFFLKDFSNRIILFKPSQNSSKLEALTLKYKYEYDEEMFSFKIDCANSKGFSITLDQLKNLLNVTEAQTTQEISLQSEHVIKTDKNTIVIKMTDGKVVTIS